MRIWKRPRLRINGARFAYGIGTASPRRWARGIPRDVGVCARKKPAGAAGGFMLMLLFRWVHNDFGLPLEAPAGDELPPADGAAFHVAAGVVVLAGERPQS